MNRTVPMVAAPGAVHDVGAILDGLQMVVQPIIDVATGAPAAVEALARFTHAPGLSTANVLAEAHAAGYGFTLEGACLSAAIKLRSELPDGVLLTMNISPDVLLHPVIARAWPADLDGFIIEVTEQLSTNPSAFRDQLANLRSRGAAIAVDDVSTGYAGLLRLASLKPGYVKVDRQVVAGVHDSSAQSAVLEALVSFSHRLGAAVIGEGVESLQDLTALAEFDVDYGQGWTIGRPSARLGPIPAIVVDTCQAGRRRVLRDSVAAGHTAIQTRDLHAVTAALARASRHSDIHAAVAKAANDLGVDNISVSLVSDDGLLREISSNDAQVDVRTYALDDYPATRGALETGTTIEVHVEDPACDRQEVALLEELGFASLLLTSLRLGDKPLGLLEFAHRSPRRWSTQDMAHAYGLAEHLVNALANIEG